MILFHLFRKSRLFFVCAMHADKTIRCWVWALTDGSRVRNLPFILIAALLLVSCSSNKPAAKPETQSAATVENKSLEGTYWVLTELNGTVVAPPKEGEKPSFIYLNADKKRVSLSGGCNMVGGSYELLGGNRIRFSQMMGTLMACPDMTNEEGLRSMVELVDNYAIQGENLSFARARMAPAARFTAAPIPSGMKLN